MVKIDYKKEQELLQAKVEAYARSVEKILDKFAVEATSLASESGYSGNEYFRIDDYPEIKKRFEKLQRKSAREIRSVVINGATALWADSNFRNDKLAQAILGNKADFEEYAVYFNNNKDALNSFLKRQRNGLNLSQRIWRIEEEFKESFEAAITVAMQEGRSAAQLSRDVRQYLREPDKMFPAINDPKTGKFIRNPEYYKYHPGAGMYRSSYKNALRLAATEINMAYRTADQVRWGQLDFVVGYEVKRSKTNPYDCPICEALAGRYPKDFVFSGWHPWCRCYMVPILKTVEEMERDDERIMSRKKPLVGSVNRVTSVPSGYRNWIADNSDRIRQANKRGTLPFFLRDNSYSQYFK